MYTHRLVIVTFLCLAVGLTASAQQQMTENFDAGQPNNWEIHDGAKITQQRGMGNVLSFQEQGFAGWMVDLSPKFTLQFQAMAQQENMFGVVFLGSGEPPNQSEYQLVHEDNQFHLLKMGNDRESGLGTGPGLQPGTWATVRLQVNAGQISVSVNNQQIISATDQNPLQQGGLAFHGFGVSIDNVSLSGAGGAPPTQPAGAAGGGQPAGGQQGGGGGGQMPLPESGGGGGYAMTNYNGNLNLGPNVNGVYLLIPGVEGACVQQGLKGWMECSDWEYMLMRPVMAQTGQVAASAGPMSQLPLRVTKRLDIATPVLWQYVGARTPVKLARLVVVNQGRVAIDLRMTNITIVEAGRPMIAAAGTAMPANMETVGIVADSVEWHVPAYDDRGKPKGSRWGGYNYSTGKPANVWQ
jgi:type VI protein secretion system component Hcp